MSRKNYFLLQEAEVIAHVAGLRPYRPKLRLEEEFIRRSVGGKQVGGRKEEGKRQGEDTERKGGRKRDSEVGRERERGGRERKRERSRKRKT